MTDKEILKKQKEIVDRNSDGRIYQVSYGMFEAPYTKNGDPLEYTSLGVREFRATNIHIAKEKAIKIAKLRSADIKNALEFESPQWSELNDATFHSPTLKDNEIHCPILELVCSAYLTRGISKPGYIFYINLSFYIRHRHPVTKIGKKKDNNEC